ncbi:MAG: PAS domain S-box protein [Acidobacteriia bacterium]|nr:PAS domain S-box protein [Terriglobia bacterium]
MTIPSPHSQRWTAQWRKWIVYLLLGTIVSVLGIEGAQWRLQRLRQAALDYWQGRLASVADVTKFALQSWGQERRSDALFIAGFVLKDPESSILLSPAKGQGKSPRATARMEHDLKKFRLNSGYEGLWVIDTNGRVVLSGLGIEATPTELNIGLRSIQSGRFQIVGPRRNELNHTLITVSAPMSFASEATPSPKAEIIGAVVLSVDPQRYIFPLVNQQNMPTETGENILVARLGNEYEILSPLSHPPRPPLEVQMPWASAPELIRRAVEGRDAFGVFNDYRGRRVVAVTRHVAGTIGLIRQVDESEAFAGTRRQARTEALLVMSLLTVMIFAWLTYQRAMRLDRLQEVAASEAKLSGIIRSAMDAIITIDANQKISLLNAAAESMFQYKNEDLLGQPIEMLIPQRFRQGHADHVRTFDGSSEIARPMSQRPHLSGLRRNGQEFPIEASISKTTLDHKHVYTAIIRDVTDRQRAQALLQGEKYILEMIANGSPLDVTLSALARLIEGQSQRMFCSILLLGPDGKHLLHGAAPSLPVEYNQAVNGIEIGPQVGSCGTAAFRREPVVVTDISADPLWGSAREMALAHGLRACWSSPIFSIEKEVLGTFALYFQDPRPPNPSEQQLVERGTHLAGIAIERYRSEQLLRAAEEKYRTLFEESKDVVYISTPEGKLTDINAAGVEYFGYGSKEEILKVDVARDLYFNPPDRENVLRVQNAEGYIKDFEIFLKRKDGKKLDALETATVIRNVEGKVVGYRGILRDITERRNLEQQLFQARKMEAIGQLAGGIAHDFNNILTAITGYANLLDARLGPDHPLRHNVTEITRAAQRAASLTQQLLAFGRRQLLHLKVLDLNAAITDLSQMLSRLIGENLQLVTDLDPRLGRIKADPSQIEQVLINLVVNARDAMPRGGRLTIRTSNSEVDETQAEKNPEMWPGRFVVLEVTDTGSGMDSDVVSRLFEPFFTTKEFGKGTGLGLSTVYGIVKQNNGYITVESEIGKGSAFRVYLPQVDEPMTETASSVKTLPLTRFGSETILLVEDEEAVRSLAREILEMKGYRVIEARDGVEAVAVAEQFPDEIHLLLTDVVMPRMSGHEAAQRLVGKRPSLKVLYMSGYPASSAPNLQEAFGEGRFLQKPFSPDSLSHQVREALAEVL